MWRSGRNLRQELEATQEAAPAGEEQQTSAKFFELAKIIHGLGEAERVLVVSPLKSMLNDVRKEMAKLRINLAILRGLQGPITRPRHSCPQLERG